MVEAKDWDGLLAQDQLLASRALGSAFVGFEEGRSAFKPTFKVRSRVAPVAHAPTTRSALRRRRRGGCGRALGRTPGRVSP